MSSTVRAPGGQGRPVTMRDVARAVGVTQSTVSRILNNAPLAVPVAPQTRERVLEAARRLGYRPNPMARALRGAPTMLLGAIVRDITDLFFAGAIEAVSTAARQRGYNVVLGHAHGRATEAFVLAAMLEARQCDALLVLGDMRDQPSLIEDLRASSVPVVALWQGSELHGICSVNVDNAAGIVSAIGHLRDLGHRRIAFLGGRPLGDIRERQRAFVDSFNKGELPRGYVRHVANSPSDGAAALQALMRLRASPTAIVASTDVLAAGVLHGAAALGMRVPDDLSVVGFDDISIAPYLVPALTTVRMPTAAMAEAAVSLAVQMASVEGQERSPQVRLFRPELVVRASTAPPPTSVSTRPRNASGRASHEMDATGVVDAAAQEFPEGSRHPRDPQSVDPAPSTYGTARVEQVE